MVLTEFAKQRIKILLCLTRSREIHQRIGVIVTDAMADPFASEDRGYMQPLHVSIRQ